MRTGRQLLRCLFVSAALLAGVLAPERPARAAVVERVIAVVGERAILLSDLRDRAKPFMVRIYQEVPAGAQRSAAISQTYKAVLERMVDEELEVRAANRAKLVVTAKEIDEAIARIAAQNGLSVEQIVLEARRSGLNERQYRQEVRRQVLEAKLLNLRVQGRIRVTEEDLRSSYRRIVSEERRKLRFRAAWIEVAIPAGADREAVNRARDRADKLAAQAAANADFHALARRYSDDENTRKMGGLLGRLKPGQLPPQVDAVILGLEVGETAGPVRNGDRFLVLKLLEREESELPSYEEAKNELAERVYLEKMNKARRQWLDGLRNRTHIEIRL